MARMVLVLACLATAACGGLKKSDEAGNASGKVLAGSISDAMINHDQSHAEAPLAGPGAGVPAGDNQAARDLLAAPVKDGATDAGAATPATPQDQPSKAAPPASATGVRDKPAEKPVEPVATPAKPAAKPAVKPAASAPAKPKPKPAFSKPSDDGT